MEEIELEESVIEDKNLIHDNITCKYIQYAASIRKRYNIILCVYNLILLILFMMWLSESQFGEGILRQKYFNESCNYVGRTCVDGLSCKYGKCDKMYYPVYQNYSCVECPVCNPCSINKLVSYFDYNEMQGYLRPWSYDHIDSISYGACKELCSQQKNCSALCYSDDKCFLKSSYILPVDKNITSWICSIKIK